MDDEIKVSVVIPIYNVQFYLKQCLDSVLSQSLIEIEIICVNDGSTDGSVQILEEYTKNDRVQIIDQENTGQGIARNKGIMAAKGKYVTFIDPDDYYAADDVLEVLYICAEKENAMICCGNVRDIKGKYIGKRFSKNKMMQFTGLQNCGYHVGTIFNLDFLKQNKIIYPGYRRFEDPPFLTKAMLQAREFYAVNLDAYIYRTGHKSLNVTEEIVLDVINGVKDILEMIYTNGNILKEFAAYVFNGNREFIIRYSCSRMKSLMIINAIDELNTVVHKVLGENYVLTQKMIADYQCQCLNIYMAIKNKEPVIIYGAGIVGKSVASEICSLGGNIIGIAVSDVNENSKSVEGLQVRKIVEYIEYVDEVNVIIATSIKYMEEIKGLLNKYHFKKISIATQYKLEYIKRLLENQETLENLLEYF